MHMHPPGRIKKIVGQIYRESCKCILEAEEKSIFRKLGDLDGGRGYLGSFSVCFEGDD